MKRLSKDKKRPNIIMVHCHDLGQHLGCYGTNVETPNIDSLAENGIKFNNYFSTACFCAPSRLSRSTGLYPSNHGVTGNVHLGWKIKPGIKTLPMYLNEAGYDTHLIGFQHESFDPKTLGYKNTQHAFSSSYSSGPLDAPDVTPRVLEFLEQRRAEDGPFYLDVGFREVHRVLPECGYENWVGTEPPRSFKVKYVGKDAKEGYTDKDAVVRVNHANDVDYFREYLPEEVDPLPYLPDRPGVRRDLADLQSLITCVLDKMVGKISDKIKESGLEDNTLVIFTTDHGIDMPRAKMTLYDPGTKIAFIMRWPAGFKSNVTYNELLSCVDFLPTILEIAGVESPDNIDGRSFLPLIENREYTEHKNIFTENTWHGAYIPMRALRTKRYKFILNFDSWGEFFTEWESHAGREFIGRGLGSFRPVQELYDLEQDPYEQNNLAASVSKHSEYGDIIKSFKDELKKQMMVNNDPLLKGPVPHPSFKHIWDV